MRQISNILLGFIFTMMSAQFLLVLMLGAAIAPDYSIQDNAISDLGVISETALLFNSSLFLFGLLVIIGAYFYQQIHGKRWLTIIILSSGIGAIGVALFPLNNPGIHAIFALIAFLFANFIPIAISTILQKPLNILSILTGVVGLFFLFVHLLSDMNLLSLYSLIGHGGSERMIVYPALLWLVAFGGYLMASSPEKITESAS